MGKVKRLYVCEECGRSSGQWAGRCSGCGGWGTIAEQRPSAGAGRDLGGRPIAAVGLAPDPEERRIGTGLPGMDRVLGGGLVPGSVVLLAGAPGIGKSTLLLQVASRLSGAGHPCMIASGEEARGQVAARALRLQLPVDGVTFVPGRDLADVVGAALRDRPTVLIVDSIQTVRDADAEGLPGGTAQVRTCTDALVAVAKDEAVAVVLVGHVTKGGDLAGPRTLEHAVDAVLSFEGEPRSGLRVLAGGKNRFGPEGEVAWFEMTSAGLVEAEPGPMLGRDDGEAGCAVAVALAGRRALAVDVQALVVPSEGPPRRQVSGLDGRRFSIIAAVTDRALGGRLGRAELYGACSGGLRLDDPAADLAVAAALASSSSGRPLPPGAAFVGELALTGTVRAVPGMEQRAAAATAAGVRTIVAARGSGCSAGSRGSLRMVEVGHVREVVAWAARSPK